RVERRQDGARIRDRWTAPSARPRSWRAACTAGPPIASADRPGRPFSGRPGRRAHLHLSVLPDVEKAQVGPPASGNTASPHWPFEAIGESMTIVPFTGISFGATA